MTREQVNKWIIALRSGEYAQARGDLTKEVTLAGGDECKQGYCCIGVALHTLFGDTEIEAACEYDETGHSDPTQHAVDKLKIAHVSDNLITLNDTQMQDFPAIADWIEENKDRVIDQYS